MDKKIKAKKIRISNLYPWQLKRTGNLLNGKCPFHEDLKHPNFYIYPQTNSWYCFAGCGGGDSIAFYMRLKNKSFQQAIKELSE